jgi:hypothetical protein
MPITSSVTGPAQDNSDRLVTISHFDDAGSPAAASYNLGFIPRYVRVDNVTDRILNEWYQGMTSDHAVRTVAAGTRTLETSAGITLSGTTIGFAVAQNKQYRVVAFG